MTRDLLPELLQECLAAYEAGLSPQECLSAYPIHRAELEPLFREAIQLRVSFAAAPSEEFRERAKERLMFAAGREVSQAFASRPEPEFKQRAKEKLMFAAGREVSEAFESKPDPRFVASARRRMLGSAGWQAQDALRDVPPPRLPFWWNTRRRLLEAAQTHPPRQVRPAPALALRGALSMAVVVLAIAVAGFAFLVDERGTPTAASEIAQLEQQLRDIEARQQSGQPVSEATLLELSRRTHDLASKYSDHTGDGTQKLPALIERQTTILNATEVNSAELRAAQQQLNEAAKTLAAASPTPATAALAAAATSTPQPATPTAIPVSPTATPVLPPVPVNYVHVRALPDDNAFGQTWVQIRTANFSFNVPGTWSVPALTPDANGIASFPFATMGLLAPGTTVLIGLNTGEITANFNNQGVNQSVVLRSAGPRGQVIGIFDLVNKLPTATQEFTYMLGSFQPSAAFLASPQPAALPPISQPPATQTSTAVPATTATPRPPTATPPAATATPQPTSTPRPAGTPATTTP